MRFQALYCITYLKNLEVECWPCNYKAMGTTKASPV